MRKIHISLLALWILSVSALSLRPALAQVELASVQSIFLGDRECGDNATDCLFPLAIPAHRYLHVVIHEVIGDTEWAVQEAPDCLSTPVTIASGQPVPDSGFLEVVVDLSLAGLSRATSSPCIAFRGQHHFYAIFYAAYTDDDPNLDAESVYPGYETLLGRPDLPDLDVTYIQRTPSYAYDAAKNLPAPGDRVVYTAHIKNSGALPSGPFDYSWFLDGHQISSGGVSQSLGSGAETSLDLTTVFRSGPHILTIRLFPSSLEVSTANDMLSIRTDALTLGIWIEQSALQYFDDYQWTYCSILQCAGSDSFADWLKRQVDAWNSALASSAYDVAGSAAVADRVRVDEISVVPDGSLPLHGGLASNNPDSADHSVDLEWGITAADVASTYHHMWDGPFDVDWGMIHELSHARSLADLYRFDIPLDGNSVVDVRDAAGNQIYDPSNPFDLTKKLVAFRGDEGNAFLFRDAEQDLMSCTCDPTYSSYSAMVLNRLRGRRARCGNGNPPCNLGDWFLDLPPVNEIRLLDASGRPLPAGSTVRTYFDSGTTYTGHHFQQQDSALYTVTGGLVRLQRDPFHSRGDSRLAGHNLLLIEVRDGQQDYFCFIEPTTFNEADWMGYSDIHHPALYSMRLGVSAENDCNLTLPPALINEPFATSPYASSVRRTERPGPKGSKVPALEISLRDDGTPPRPMWRRRVNVLAANGKIIGRGVTDQSGDVLLLLPPGSHAARVVDITDNKLVIPWGSTGRRIPTDRRR